MSYCAQCKTSTRESDLRYTDEGLAVCRSCHAHFRSIVADQEYRELHRRIASDARIYRGITIAEFALWATAGVAVAINNIGVASMAAIAAIGVHVVRSLTESHA